MGFGGPGFKFQLCHFLHVERCVSSLTSLTFSFLICETDMARPEDVYETCLSELL